MLFAPPPVYNDPYGEFTTAFKPLDGPDSFRSTAAGFPLMVRRSPCALAW